MEPSQTKLLAHLLLFINAKKKKKKQLWCALNSACPYTSFASWHQLFQCRPVCMYPDIQYAMASEDKSVTSDPQCTVRCQQTQGSLLSAGNTFGHTASVAAAQISFQTAEHHPHQTKPALQLKQLMVRLNKLFRILRHLTSHCLLWTCQVFYAGSAIASLSLFP